MSKSTKATRSARKPATTDAAVAKFDKELAGVPTKPKAPKAKGPAAARPGSKLEQIIKMMRSAKGATLAEMSKATGWKPQSVRGVIRNAVAGRLGLKVTLSPSDKGTVFTLRGGK